MEVNNNNNGQYYEDQNQREEIEMQGEEQQFMENQDQMRQAPGCTLHYTDPEDLGLTSE